jgi:hypothetical protein
MVGLADITYCNWSILYLYHLGCEQEAGCRSDRKTDKLDCFMKWCITLHIRKGTIYVLDEIITQPFEPCQVTR